MKAMVINQLSNLSKTDTPLDLMDLPMPEPENGEVRIEVHACGVCHTELDEIEGRTPPPILPMIPGHQVVGVVDKVGPGVNTLALGDRVGVAWIYDACGHCRFCDQGNENLCREFRATGRDAHGGYAEYMVVKQNFAFPIPDRFTDVAAAPLLCAGAIGYRSLRLTGMADGDRLGLVGFGASAHLVLKLARHLFPNSDIFVFARSPGEREFALELGAAWAGDIDSRSPENLNCAIDTTPAWKPVVEALKNLEKGGRLVINAIRKEETDKDQLIRVDYPTHLWMEKEIKSVANVATRDVREFIKIAAEIPIVPETREFPLEDANVALMELKRRKIRGAKVLRVP